MADMTTGKSTTAAARDAGIDPGLLREQSLPMRYLRAIKTFAQRKPVGAITGAVIIIFALAAGFADVVAPYGQNERDSTAVLAGPSFDHWLGTDQLGRDTLSRVIHGARLTLYIGLAVTLISTVVGTAVGVIAGYLGGKVDLTIGVVVDAVMAFPSLVLAIALVTALGASTTNVILAVLLPVSARVARIVRSNVLGVRSMPYVEASRAIGCGNVRTLLRYIVPNVMATVIVLASLNLPTALLVEASLSFLGLGPPPPAASWGRMLSDEGQLYYRDAWWLVVWPGFALAIIVYCFNLFGDALRDHLDPRLRAR